MLEADILRVHPIYRDFFNSTDPELRNLIGGIPVLDIDDLIANLGTRKVSFLAEGSHSKIFTMENPDGQGVATLKVMATFNDELEYLFDLDNDEFDRLG